MAYDLSRLTTQAMCDRAKALAQAVYDDLLFDRSLVTRHGAAVEAGATSTDATLSAVTTEATAIASTVATMVPGPLREKYERKLRRLTERRSQLQDRLADFDGVEQTDTTFDLRLIDLSLAETTLYLSELADYRATLPS
jgi:hypothetical protein